MQDASENTDNTTSVPQQSGLMSTIFREYLNQFGLFWRVMLPLIAVSLLFIVAALLLFLKFGSSESQWIFSTSDGSSRTIEATFDLSSGTSQSSTRSVGVHWKISFTALTLYPKLGFLWLAMCPLAFVIIQYRRSVNVTFRTSWQRTLRRTAPILGVWIVLWLLGLGIFAGSLLTLALPGFPPLLTPLLFMILVAYFVAKWSLYHQSIIIENLSAIAALRRSSELVGGTWGRLIGIYLLFAWASTVSTTALLSLTVLLLSFATPEFEMVREELLSAKFFTLLWGSFPEITLDSPPSFWVLAVLGIATTLIHAILAPIWALLTTHLYMERAGIQQDTVSH